MKIQPYFDYSCHPCAERSQQLVSRHITKTTKWRQGYITKSNHYYSATALRGKPRCDLLYFRREKQKFKLMFKTMNDETPQYLAYFNPLALSMDLQLYRGNKIAELPSLLCPSLKSQSDTT